MLTEKQKSDWIAALRSGEYKQGRDLLKKRGGKFCCLGVLTEINGWSFENKDCLSEEGAKALSKSESRVTSVGIHGAMGLPNYKDTQYSSLAEMNDAGVSFAEIADFLEEHLPTCKS